jgi:Sec-independent protein translocase protein TatA
MRLFNIGLPELVFIVLLTFIVLGPQRAVEAAGNLGRWIRKVIKSPFWRDLVSTSNDLKDIPRKIMDDAEIQKTLDDIDRSTRIGKSKLDRATTQNETKKGEIEVEEHKISPN